MTKLTSLLTGLVLCFAGTQAHAAIQNIASDATPFMVAELDSSSSHSNVQKQFSELNKMIEPAAGDVETHAKSMHDSHHAVVEHAKDAAHDAHHEADAHYSDAHHDDHGTGGLPQFDPTWFPSQIFWLAVTFLVMYLFFSMKALPSIATSLDARETRIKTDIETAEKINEQAAEVKAEYEKILQDSKDSSSQIIASTQDDIKAKANEAVDAFRANQEKVIKDLENSINAAKEDALSDMHGVAADAAQQAAAKIIDVDTDIKAVKSVVEKLDKAA